MARRPVLGVETSKSVCSVMARDDDDKQTMSPLMLDDSLSSSSTPDSPRFTPLRFASRRRRIVITTAAAVTAISLLVLAYLSSSRPLLLVPHDPVATSDVTPSSNRKSALLGPPTTRFRGSSQG